MSILFQNIRPQMLSKKQQLAARIAKVTLKKTTHSDLCEIRCARCELKSIPLIRDKNYM